MPYRFENKVVFGLGERGSGFKVRSIYGYQDFEKIKRNCLSKGILFEDDEFPAEQESIGNITLPRNTKQLEWRRPPEIVKDPQYVVNGADRFDIRQGQVGTVVRFRSFGNCWFLAAAAALTMDPGVFCVVVPEDGSFEKDYCGVFHFRFWQYGVWVDVVIDDLLPVNPRNGKLVFMKSESINEFWSPLLEKAYAKLNGSYAALDGGFTFEALEDFTGGFTELILMDMDCFVSENGEDALFKLMSKAYERSSFMGASVKADPEVIEAEDDASGLICGHAYSVTGVATVRYVSPEAEGNVQLLRLRNPWGTDKEWKGDFSDSSPAWSNVPKEDKLDLDLVFSADGEFWISMQDFMKYFERIEVCHLNPGTAHTLEQQKGRGKKWFTHAFDGKWVPGVTAGGSYQYIDTYAINPQFILEVTEPDPGYDKCTVVVALLKTNRKVEGITEVEDVCFELFRLKDDYNYKKPLQTKFFETHTPLEKQFCPPPGPREVTVRFYLEPGRYMVVPSAIKPNQKGDFLIRVFTELQSTMEPYDQTIKRKDANDDRKEKDIEGLQKLQRFFNNIAGKDKEVDWWELKMVLDKSFHDEFQYEGFGFSEDSCRSMVALVDTDRSGRMGFFEFAQLWSSIIKWREIFHIADRDRSRTLGSMKASELRNALSKAGYEVNKTVLGDLVMRYGDRQGEIALDKFVMLAVKLDSMFDLFERRDIDGTNNATLTLDEWLSDTLYS